MTAMARPLRRLFRRPGVGGEQHAIPAPTASVTMPGVTVDIPETDPLFVVLQSSAGPVDIGTLELASPALQQLRDAGVALVVPLPTAELLSSMALGD